MEKPKVEHVEGLSPTVSIDQKSRSHSPRSTVGTLTEILDFMRLFMARLGTPYCPECGAAIESWSVDQIVEAICERHEGKALLLLAPVVRDRKGEYREQLAEFRSKGYVRARIDGEVRRLDEDIRLARYKYHTIELVQDRLRIQGDVASRVAEAVEQSIALAQGLVAVVGADADTDAAEGKGYELFSTLRACPEGHGSVPEMEPRLSSFNSPVGACPACDGLGEVSSFSEKLLVRDPALSLAEGALLCFTAEGKLAYGRYRLEHLAQVGEVYGFDLNTPWKKLSRKQKDVILHGSGKKTFKFTWQSQGQNYRSRGREQRAFPGVMPHLKRVYRRATARHLDKFREAVTCAECEGSRLNRNARSVRYEGTSLPEWTAMTVEDAARYFDGLELKGNRLKIGGEVLLAIRQHLEFLLHVGLGYLCTERRASTLSGGESHRIRLAAQVGSGLRGNSVFVVEHDEETMRASDHLVDIGPGAGRSGGELVVAGTPLEVSKHKNCWQRTSATSAACSAR